MQIAVVFFVVGEEKPRLIMGSVHIRENGVPHFFLFEGVRSKALPICRRSRNGADLSSHNFTAESRFCISPRGRPRTAGGLGIPRGKKSTLTR